jgi:pyridoxamine 5'-phosphate oxidase
MSVPSDDRQPTSVPADLRVDYARGALDERDVLADPVRQFARWFDEARAANVPEPNAMTLATAAPGGAPSARVVLLKLFDDRGFTFHTNYASRKARELAVNPRAALCIHWQPLERQVRIEGTVERVSAEESKAYFRSRPVAAQIGAWVSQQSTPIASREELEKLNRELTQRFANGPVPRPEHWGGLRVVPHAIEFWQGRPSRLHDRILYTRQPDGSWTRQRLAP